MLKVVLSNRFKKDLKLISKRNYNIDLLERVVDMIANGIQLPERYKDHSLSGDYIGFRECHIQNDWLLVYKIEEEELYLFLSRTGTHSDLFS